MEIIDKKEELIGELVAATVSKQLNPNTVKLYRSKLKQLPKSTLYKLCAFRRKK